MIRLATIFASIALPAVAGDYIGEGGTGCHIVATPDRDAAAMVTCGNVKTTGNAVTEGAIEVDGISVHVTIIHNPGNVPDTFTFTPLDPGHIAQPGEISLEEWSIGAVRIYPWTGS
jgi:hypothetical protein